MLCSRFLSIPIVFTCVWPITHDDIFKRTQSIHCLSVQFITNSKHNSRFYTEFWSLRFQSRIISRRSSVPWPAQSPDLNPLDFWLWGHLASKIFKINPRTVPDLIAAVDTACTEIPTSVVAKSTKNIRKRMSKCLDISGGHFQRL